MTRTNKWTVHEKKSEPKWFTHHESYYLNSDPTKVKKFGAGKNNWGKPGDELNDDEEYINFSLFNKSNMSAKNMNHFENESKMNDLYHEKI
ncbi:hypothetical protein DFJ63DRAFT_319452 [Scheffersomyces coipomensis]|uniref:uncharacterized protein n=1 Tax=Scheffersomyces coipomensis TaxID=1788519 RepID=UPI00315D0CAE